MGIKVYKPVTASQRFHQSQTWTSLTKDRPEKSLVKGSSFKAGRSASSGRITVRRKGGRHKRLYRMIDFHRSKYEVPAKVASIEYDPNRTSNIALLHYADGDKRYILATKGMKVGQEVLSGASISPQEGNHLLIKNIPLGTLVHNVELRPGNGGKLVRAAGGSAVLLAKDNKYATIRLSSGESRMILQSCYATVGVVSNADHMNSQLGKAGRARWLGRRPKVRGVAMNPVDHPHGGGEGKTSGGRHPVSPWGMPTKGYKTRKKRKTSSKYILRSGK